MVKPVSEATGELSTTGLTVAVTGVSAIGVAVVGVTPSAVLDWALRRVLRKVSQVLPVLIPGNTRSAVVPLLAASFVGVLILNQLIAMNHRAIRFLA